MARRLTWDISKDLLEVFSEGLQEELDDAAKEAKNETEYVIYNFLTQLGASGNSSFDKYRVRIKDLPPNTTTLNAPAQGNSSITRFFKRLINEIRRNTTKNIDVPSWEVEIEGPEIPGLDMTVFDLLDQGRAAIPFSAYERNGKSLPRRIPFQRYRGEELVTAPIGKIFTRDPDPPTKFVTISYEGQGPYEIPGYAPRKFYQKLEIMINQRLRNLNIFYDVVLTDDDVR